MKTTKEMLKKEVENQKLWIEDCATGKGESDFDEVMDDVLDIEIIRSLRGDFRGFEITLCLGNPNIFLSRHISQYNTYLKGVWGSESVELPLNEETSDMLIEYMEELADFYA